MLLKRLLRNSLIYTLILSFCLTALPTSVQAADLDSFIGFLEKVEDVGGAEVKQSLPFTSDQVKDVRDVVNCLDNSGNDIDVAICIDQFHDSGTGQQAGSGAEIPSWVYDLLDAYIMYRTGDYWGLAKKLGEAAFCVVIQILVGGADVCGLLEELVELAGALWDAGKALVEWASSVGGDVYDAIKGAACGATFGLVGCDDKPETPPEVWVYTYIFDAKLAEGLAARKSQDQYAFDHLVDQLRANAAANPPVYSTALPPDISGGGIWEQVIGNACAKPWAVDRAVKVFTATVNTMWTSDLGNSVLPLRSERFNQYNNSTNVNFLTLEALQSFTLGQSWDPRTPVVKRCEQTFVDDFKFAHIDRWLGMVNSLGDDAQNLKPAVQSNYALCNSFWELRKNDFAAAVFDYTRQKHCGIFGNSLMCGSVAGYRTCTGLLTPFGDSDKCRINTLTAGKEAADKVMQQVKQLGTAFPVWMMTAPPTTLGVSTQPYKLIGHRPTHEHNCETIYQNYFRDIPQRLLTCGYRAESDYQELVTAVKQAVVQINQQQGNSCQSGLFVDPLAVLAATPSTVNELQQENRNFGFKPPSLKPGFDYSTLGLPESIDGLKTPLIFYDLPGALGDMAKEVNVPVQEKIPAMVDPLGPISDKLSGLHGRDQLQAAAGGKLSGIAKNELKTIDRQGLTPRQNLTGQQALGRQQTSGAQQQVMSGTLPGGKLPAKPKAFTTTDPKLGIVKTATLKPTVMGLPDLQVTEILEIAGQQVRWNGMLNLDAATLQPTQSGRCQVPTRLVVKNTGAAASAACQFGWPELTDSQPLSALAAGQSQSIDSLLELPVGVHRLQLQLDKLQQVAESNETNNSAAVTLRLSGVCRGAAGKSIPAKGILPQPLPLDRKPLLKSTTDPRSINPQPEPPGSTLKETSDSDFLLKR